MSLKLSQKGLVIVLVPLAFQLLFMSVLAAALQNAENVILRERHARAVSSESNALFKNIMDTELALYMYGSTNSESALDRFKQLNKQIPEQISTLKTLLRSSPNEKQAYERIVRVGNRTSQLLAQGSEIVADSGAVKRLHENREAMETLLSDLTSDLRAFVRDQEEEQASARDPAAETNSRTLIGICLAVGTVLNIMIAVGLAVFFNRGTSRRLLIVMDNADRLERQEELHQAVDGNDEIAHIDGILHKLSKSSFGRSEPTTKASEPAQVTPKADS